MGYDRYPAPARAELSDRIEVRMRGLRISVVSLCHVFSAPSWAFQTVLSLVAYITSSDNIALERAGAFGHCVGSRGARPLGLLSRSRLLSSSQTCVATPLTASVI